MTNSQSPAKTIFVTGGAGFIGSALVRHLIQESPHNVVNVDTLTYAGNLDSIAPVQRDHRYHFENSNICDAAAMEKLFTRYQPDGVIHLAAESHVDRSIDGPSPFIESNIVGTYVLLEASRKYWTTLKGDKRADFRFHHVSTDEVFGSLGDAGLFTETTAYQPNSPYSASKAASDHLVRAWHHTYGLPVVTSNCSNNYGPYHFPEKLIPLTILNALRGKALPVYGNGRQVRDWLFVEDHARALRLVFEQGQAGETYNIGGQSEHRNIEVVNMICDLLEELRPDKPAGIPGYRVLIQFVTDRPGHDLRYAMDISKIRSELGWRPQETLHSGLRKTVEWYLLNETWWQRVLDGSYNGQRLGLNPNQ